MTISSVGDLASSIQLRRDTARIKTDLERLTGELSSGVTADVAGKLGGDYSFLAGLEQGLARMESYASVISERRLVLTAQQATIAKLREFGDVSAVLLTLPETANHALITNAGADALSRFASAVGAMNIQVGGQSVFSGVATDQPALADDQTILAALESEIALAGATTAADVETVVDTWFAVGGGFDTTGYLGGAPATAPLKLSDSEIAPPPVNAEDAAIRDQFAALSLGALLGRNVLAAAQDEQADLARRAGERLIASDESLIELQAKIGITEQQVARATAEVSSQADGLQLARTELIEVDPYDTAVRLQNAEIQLQTVYAITARLSRLSLVEYL